MNEDDINPAGLLIEPTNYPKVTVLPGPDFFSPRVFIGETEFPHEVWNTKVEFLGANEVKVILEFPASAVEFKKVD